MTESETGRERTAGLYSRETEDLTTTTVVCFLILELLSQICVHFGINDLEHIQVKLHIQELCALYTHTREREGGREREKNHKD